MRKLFPRLELAASSVSLSEGNAYTSAGREGNAHAYRRGLGEWGLPPTLFGADGSGPVGPLFTLRQLTRTMTKLDQKMAISQPNRQKVLVGCSGHIFGQLRKIGKKIGIEPCSFRRYGYLFTPKLENFRKFRLFRAITFFWLGLARCVWRIDL